MGNRNNMKIEYSATINEAVDCQMQLLQSTSVINKGRVKSSIWIATIAFVFMFAITEGVTGERIFFGLVVAIPGFIANFLGYKKQFKKNLKKILIEELGTAKPLPSVYELTDDFLSFKKLGSQLNLYWEWAKSVNVTNQYIQIYFEPNSIALLPLRIFENDNQKELWLNFIEHKLNKI